MDKRFYDLLIIFDVKEEKREMIISEITEIIKKKEGDIEKIEEWGIRTLAYPIKKQQEGFYVLIRFFAKPEAISSIREVLKIQEKVLRYLITKRKKPLPKEKENKEETQE